MRIATLALVVYAHGACAYAPVPAPGAPSHWWWPGDDGPDGENGLNDGQMSVAAAGIAIAIVVGLGYWLYRSSSHDSSATAVHGTSNGPELSATVERQVKAIAPACRTDRATSYDCHGESARIYVVLGTGRRLSRMDLDLNAATAAQVMPSLRQVLSGLASDSAIRAIEQHLDDVARDPLDHGTEIDVDGARISAVARPKDDQTEFSVRVRWAAEP